MDAIDELTRSTPVQALRKTQGKGGAITQTLTAARTLRGTIELFMESEGMSTMFDTAREMVELVSRHAVVLRGAITAAAVGSDDGSNRKLGVELSPEMMRGAYAGLKNSKVTPNSSARRADELDARLDNALSQVMVN